MFSLFRSRPTLASLIPGGCVDIHSHLLYGLDDGAKEAEDTLSLARRFVAAGYTHCIATPHIMNTFWDNDADGIRARLQDVRRLLTENDVPLQVNAAAEYMMDTGFLPLVQQKALLPLQDNKVLVEMSYLGAPINLYEILFELQLAGYSPVLAHPERYGFYHGNKAEYDKLKHAGCLFQINLLSTMGYYGDHVARTADYLLAGGLIDFAGSDWHHNSHAAAIGRKITIRSASALESALERTKGFIF